MTAWTISDCPVCRGSGIEFRCDCDAPCDHYGKQGHDRNCVRCDATGLVPNREEGFAAFAATFAVECFPTKRATLAYIERIAA